MDREVIEQKLESLRRCLKRIAEKCPAESEKLINDLDLQDIIALNLSRAVQLCVDIGASRPQQPHLALRLKKAVGFLNIAVHNV